MDAHAAKYAFAHEGERFVPQGSQRESQREQAQRISEASGYEPGRELPEDRRGEDEGKSLHTQLQRTQEMAIQLEVELASERSLRTHLESEIKAVRDAYQATQSALHIESQVSVASLPPLQPTFLKSRACHSTVATVARSEVPCQ